ncbi:protein FAR-RED IMPAIRED RESPONSE 1-like [Camellia sinensis]|uniref:protein FAR-RED IMPAIRED RESPONSE 1-like n=1 Tax=Camellia sinensis TaxID=4442 RepID=UPI00103630BF|nr:protein FAR-RED IMPAIRED RESPONSE 1-like [Camellia sinensis]
MPFAPFVGVNHHGQSILLGCGLLSSEDTNTFAWLFKSWLSCMSNHPPKAIITDQCRAIQNAIEIVFPQARHRWCLWHIMKKIPEKLKGYAQYEAIKLAMQNAVYDCLTRAEFESKWEEMLATFNLYDNEWLGVLYDERNRWVPVYVKDIFWAGMSTTQRSESMNAFFDGYVNPKTTLKQFVEQYDNALRNKVEKEKQADFKSRHKLFDCLTIYGFEKQFQQAYTNAKFNEVQGQMERLVYCQAVIVKEEGSICTYNVQEAMVVSEKMKHVDFVVYFNSTECEVQCISILEYFSGVGYGLPFKQDSYDREYASIKTTYTGFGNDFNASTYERMNKTFIAIVQLAGNSEGKTRIVELGLDEIKERVMKEESGYRSNLPCSTRSPIHTGSIQGGTSRKVISPLVARRRGRPVTKRKVAKVDQIVNRFKATAKKQTKAKAAKLLRFEAQAQAQAQAQTPYYPYMVGTENSMYVPVAHGIGGTSLTPSDFISGTQGSLMSAPTQIYGSASGNLDITDLFD